MTILAILTTSTLSAFQVIVPVFFVNSAAKSLHFYQAVTSLDGVTRGGPPLPPTVTPLCVCVLTRVANHNRYTYCHPTYTEIY